MLSLKKSLSILKKTDALLEGHFVLSSGLHSPKYIQCAKLLSFPNKASLICKSLANKIKKNFKKIDLILAPAMGGVVVGCEINGNKSEMQSILRNGDTVNIITSKNQSPSLHWIPVTKTGKARAAIRRYWQYRDAENLTKKKIYNTKLWISLPDQPGRLGEVTSLIGENNLNISSVEMIEKTKESINFQFNLIIGDLKNFTKLISELKQKEYNFKIIRQKDKKYAFFQRIFKGFKKN